MHVVNVVERMPLREDGDRRERVVAGHDVVEVGVSLEAHVLQARDHGARNRPRIEIATLVVERDPQLDGHVPGPLDALAIARDDQLERALGRRHGVQSNLRPRT